MDLRPDITDGEDVGTLVRAFYRVAIPDPLLGPVFAAAGIDWEVHIPHICSWWERELLGVDGRVVNMVQVHLRVAEHHDYGEAELARWIELFSETIEEHFEGPVAARAVERAEQVARTLTAALARREGRHSELTIGTSHPPRPA